MYSVFVYTTNYTNSFNKIWHVIFYNIVSRVPKKNCISKLVQLHRKHRIMDITLGDEISWNDCIFVLFVLH